MKRRHFSPRARQDLNDIWTYSLENWGEATAEDYLRRIDQVTTLIAHNPLLGRACDDIRAGYRRMRAGHHVIFYRVVQDGVWFVRILHVKAEPIYNL